MTKLFLVSFPTFKTENPHLFFAIYFFQPNKCNPCLESYKLLNLSLSTTSLYGNNNIALTNYILATLA